MANKIYKGSLGRRTNITITHETCTSEKMTEPKTRYIINGGGASLATWFRDGAAKRIRGLRSRGCRVIHVIHRTYIPAETSATSQAIVADAKQRMASRKARSAQILANLKAMKTAREEAAPKLCQRCGLATGYTVATPEDKYCQLCIQIKRRNRPRTHARMPY